MGFLQRFLSFGKRRQPLTAELLRGLGERVRAKELQRREEAFARIPDGFTSEDKGRCGYIYYREGDKMREIGWEMSGVPELDILVDGIKATWTIPAHVPIPIEQRLEILGRLRAFLAGRKLKTNVDLPADLSLTTERCRLLGCTQYRLRGQAYCRQHFDLSFVMPVLTTLPSNPAWPTDKPE